MHFFNWIVYGGDVPVMCVWVFVVRVHNIIIWRIGTVNMAPWELVDQIVSRGHNQSDNRVCIYLYMRSPCIF